MNIGILTHCAANNCGANLQALSTGCWLKKHGYTPVYILWEAYLKIEEKIMLPVQAELHRNFLSKRGYIVTEPCISDDDFLNVISKYNLCHILVGSDCVLTYSGKKFPFTLTRKGFRRISTPADFKFPNPFWLPFLENNSNVKKYMISASSGSTNFHRIKGNVKNGMSRLLSQFDYIAVRDTNAEQMVHYLIGDTNNVRITPDPVFGIDNNYLQIPSEHSIKEKFGLPDKYLVASFFPSNWPSQKWFDEFTKLSHEKGMDIVGVPTPVGGKQPILDLNIQLPLDPMDWYCIIKYSCGYIGNKMHPIIVCLRNIVPFFSFNIHGRFYLHHRLQLVRYSKEYDLLKRFNLTSFQVPQQHCKHIKPQYVIDKLLDFNLNDRMKISNTMKFGYEQMMDEVSQLIKGTSTQQ